MSRDLKYEKENIDLRRGTVLELLVKGISQTAIAKKLNVSNALISLDVQYLREKAKKQLESHFSEDLPFMFAKSLEGINNVLRRVSEILESAADNKTKMECLRLQAELYRSMLSMATDGGVIQKAMEMVKIIAPLPGEDIKIPTENIVDTETEPEVEEEEETPETTEE